MSDELILSDLFFYVAIVGLIALWDKLGMWYNFRQKVFEELEET